MFFRSCPDYKGIETKASSHVGSGICTSFNRFSEAAPTTRGLKGKGDHGPVFANDFHFSEAAPTTRGLKGINERIHRTTPDLFFRSSPDYKGIEREIEKPNALDVYVFQKQPRLQGELQTALARPAGSLEEVEATHTRLEGRPQPVRHTLRGQSPHRTIMPLTQFSGHARRRRRSGSDPYATGRPPLISLSYSTGTESPLNNNAAYTV